MWTVWASLVQRFVLAPESKQWFFPWQLILWCRFPFVFLFLISLLWQIFHTVGVSHRLEVEIPAGSGTGTRTPVRASEICFLGMQSATELHPPAQKYIF